MAETQTEAWFAQIGGRLRARRREQGLTLQALSAATGLSQAFLSRLERGQVAASIANLLEIAAALDIPMQSLFAADDAAAAAPPYEVYRADAPRDARAIPATGYTWQPVAAGRADQRMEAFLLTFPVGRKADVLVAHDGEELCFVLDGRIRFRIGGETMRLGPGDAIHLDSRLPHMAENDGSAEARILMVTSSGRRGPASFDWWNVPAAPGDGPDRRAD